jgi:hypothetical protein
MGIYGAPKASIGFSYVVSVMLTGPDCEDTGGVSTIRIG